MARNYLLLTSDEERIRQAVKEAKEQRRKVLAATAVDLHKRTVLYLDKGWNQYAQVETFSEFEKGNNRRELVADLGKYTRDLVANWRSFLNAGGQIWVSPSNLTHIEGPIKFKPQPLIEGVIVVDDKTLLTFLNQDTIVLTF